MAFGWPIIDSWNAENKLFALFGFYSYNAIVEIQARDAPLAFYYASNKGGAQREY